METIREDYVSFEIAKLLKEKRFDWECISYYVDDESDDVKYSFCGETNSDWESRCCSAPTLQMAMKWLREVHGLHITIMFSKYLYGDNPFYWGINKMIDDKREKTSTATGDYTYKCYEEAVEAAIKYCLENLI